MAASMCPKCESHKFELKDSEAPPGNGIQGAKFKYSFIQCKTCGAVVGVVDHYHLPSLLQKIAAKLGLNLFQ